jgi:4-hydroxybenzoate polyprenyltransferase
VTASRSSVLQGYLQLLRPPNIATALADVLAGFGVAGLGNPRALPWLLVGTACLYGGGIVLNDVFDRHVDAVERPERPIPSGRVPAVHAARLGCGLLALGLAAASMTTQAATAIAAAIVVAVLLYDMWGKRQRLLGPINMGACRGLNLLLGMAAVPAAVAGHWALALISLTYICAITAVSRGEVFGGTRAAAILALTLLCGVLVALLAVSIRPAQFSAMAMAVMLTGVLAWRVLPPFWRALHDSAPARIGQAVRTGVLSLVLLDGVLAAAYAGMIYSLAVLAIAFLAVRLARLFAVT